MSDIDIQIAQALGWHRHGTPDSDPSYYTIPVWVAPDGELFLSPPPFSSSLDIMHELEMMMPEEKRDEYIVSLSAQLRKHSGVMDHEWTRVTATAEQRAQAWLKVMG